MHLPHQNSASRLDERRARLRRRSQDGFQRIAKAEADGLLVTMGGSSQGFEDGVGMSLP